MPGKPVDPDGQFKAGETDVSEVVPRYQWDGFTDFEKDVIHRAVKMARVERGKRSSHTCSKSDC